MGVCEGQAAVMRIRKGGESTRRGVTEWCNDAAMLVLVCHAAVGRECCLYTVSSSLAVSLLTEQSVRRSEVDQPNEAEPEEESCVLAVQRALVSLSLPASQSVSQSAIHR